MAKPIKQYVYGWKNNAKRQALYGQHCTELARGKMNSVLVQFVGGSKEVVSRWALKEVKHG